MNDTRTPELIAALNEFADWLFRHEDLPTFFSADYQYSHLTNAWALSLHLSAHDDPQVLADLISWSAALDAPLALGQPRTSTDGSRYRRASTSGRISERLTVEVVGFLDGPEALTEAA